MGAARVNLNSAPDDLQNHSEIAGSTDPSLATMSLNFPSPEFLIAATLPIKTSQQLLEDLTSTWGQVFSLTSCAVAWLNAITRQAYVLTWHADASREVRTISSINNLTSLLQLLSVESLTTSWIGIRSSEGLELVGLIGLPNEQTEIHAPAGWLNTTALLIQSAINWESQQTAQRLEAIAEYAAGAGHEINNPLGTITGRVGQLLHSEPDEEKRRILEMIGAQAYRVRDMIGDSMTFARPPDPLFQQLNLTETVENVVKRLAVQIADRKLSVWGNREHETPVLADQSQLVVVISELILNAIQATEVNGRIIIDCTTRDVDGTNWCHLRVADNGIGMSREEWEHCLNPFYSGRQAGRGLGFGLAKCWRIITQHNGRFDFSRTETDLTEFHVWLPVTTP